MAAHQKDVVNLKQINEAAKRIENYISKTPILTSEFMNELSGRKLYFKCENLQKTGSFKYRGATNAVMRIKELRKRDKFISVTHSSGNMGQALSLASTKHGIESKVVVPDNAPIVKMNSIVRYGAQLVECESTPKGRRDKCAEVCESLGSQAEFIPASDHPFVMEGQGTIAWEMLNEVPHLDAIVVCAGSGGLISGIAAAAKTLKPSIKIYGGEPLLANDMKLSLQSGERVIFTELPHTIADGLRMSVGEHCWEYVQKYVDDVITATDEEIINAMFFLWERMKLVVEPSGAMAFASILTSEFRKLPSDIKHVGVTISGGNVDLRKLPWNSDHKYHS